MDLRYRLSPTYAVRLAGVAFDVLERLGTPAVSEAARRVNARAAAIDEAAHAALARLATELSGDPKSRSKIARKLSRRSALAAEIVGAQPWLAPYAAACAGHTEALASLEALIDSEYVALLSVLAREAGEVLPDFLLLEAPSLVDEVHALERQHGARHASQDRRRHRMLAMYLQRVCAKNDAFSRFGPTMWGTLEPGGGARVHARPGIARRVELETWAVARLIAIVNADPDVRPELAPRLHPHGRLEDDRVIRLDDQRELALTGAEHALARACDGTRSARELGDPPALADLAERGVIMWALEPFARDTAPLASLQATVAGWRDPAVRERWSAPLRVLRTLLDRFAADADVSARRAVLDELHAELERIGVVDRERTRALYAATNPINENCTLADTFALGTGACDRLIADASPWFELWQDSVALASARVYARLVELVAAAPRRAGKLVYSSLLHAARGRGFDLDRDGAVTEIARATWVDIQRQFSERLASRGDAPAWRLTAEDCTFLRRAYDLPPSGEVALPSLDLLVSAESADAAAAGRFEWVIGESHHAFALLQHATYWSCPDKASLHATIQAAAGGAPMLSRDPGNFLPVHVNPESFLATGASTYVGGARPKPGWPCVRPADAEVFVDEARSDVRLRAPSGEDLGSLFRTASLVMGMHPFFPLVRAPHEPRLYLGDVIVQRRAWHVESRELDLQRPSGVSAPFLTALERVRGERGIPRWVYVRPRSLDSAHATRDKDTKPICVDLESLVSLDIFERRLRKYEAMVLVEMVPAPDRLFLKAGAGRTVFELRTNLLATVAP